MNQEGLAMRDGRRRNHRFLRVVWCWLIEALSSRSGVGEVQRRTEVWQQHSVYFGRLATFDVSYFFCTCSFDTRGHRRWSRGLTGHNRSSGKMSGQVMTEKNKNWAEECSSGEDSYSYKDRTCIDTTERAFRVINLILLWPCCTFWPKQFLQRGRCLKLVAVFDAFFAHCSPFQEHVLYHTHKPKIPVDWLHPEILSTKRPRWIRKLWLNMNIYDSF